MSGQESAFLISDMEAIWAGWENVNLFSRIIAFPPNIYLSIWLFVLSSIIVLRNLSRGVNST
jgi:hypothetical protein